MNILVINIPNKPFTNRSIIAEPIDALQIATVIKESYKNVRVIDMDGEKMNNNINKYLQKENIVIFVYDYQIPLHTTESINNIFEIIKNTDKKSKFIIIGKRSTYDYETFLNNGVDVVIRGIADNINEVLKNINDIESLSHVNSIAIKKEGKIFLTENRNKIYDINNLPIPDRSLVDISKYMTTRTMITSRGCINKCSFCTTPTFFGNWTYKSASKVVEEIEYLIKNFNTKKIMFLDDNMTVNKNRILEICKILKEKNIKCLYGCLSSINTYDKEVFKEMYSVGFRWVHFGIESGSKKILELMNKKMDIKSEEEIINEVKMMGYRVRTSIILDYPGTTEEDNIKTLELLKKVKPHEIRLHYLAYKKGTKVTLENSKGNNTEYIHSNKPNIKNENLKRSIDKIIESLKEMGYLFIENEENFDKYENYSKDFSLVALTPIKYGMCWYE